LDDLPKVGGDYYPFIADSYLIGRGQIGWIGCVVYLDPQVATL
jgi:hypothetical protein